MKILRVTTAFLSLLSSVATSLETDEKNVNKGPIEIVAELLMKGYKVEQKGDLGSIIFDEDHYETHDHAKNTETGNNQMLRSLGDDNRMCVNKRDFFYFSQRYIISEMFNNGGIKPSRYNLPKENFDECRWLGVKCEKGIVQRLLWKDQGLVTNGEFFPQEIYVLQFLELLDISSNELLTGAFPETIDLMEELVVIEYSGTQLSGTFNCSGTSRAIQFGPQSTAVCNCKKDICYDESIGETIDDRFDDNGNDIIVFGSEGAEEEKEEKGKKGKGKSKSKDDSKEPGSPGGNRVLGTSGKICDIPSVFWYKISQRYALADLFYKTGIDLVKYGGDILVNNECDWLGVTCNMRGLVTKIELNGEGITSNRAIHNLANAQLGFDIDGDDILPDSLLYMEFLEILDVGNNPLLIGKLPSDLDDLKYLRYLDVSFTQLSGEVDCNKGGRNKIVTFGGTSIDGDERETRFGVKCDCDDDTCIFASADIRVKPFDR